MQTKGVGLSRRYLNGEERNIHDFWIKDDVEKFKVGDIVICKRLFVVEGVITDKGNFPQGFSTKLAEVVILFKEIPCAAIEKKRPHDFFGDGWVMDVSECTNQCEYKASCPFRRLYISSHL